MCLGTLNPPPCNPPNNLPKQTLLLAKAMGETSSKMAGAAQVKAALAKEFGVFNKFFSSVPSASTPNHLFTQVMPYSLTAATPMENPYRSCKLTRVRGTSLPSRRPAAGWRTTSCGRRSRPAAHL